VVLAPGNTKDQQNEQPKAGRSSGTSSLCPLDLIDEDSDHNQNDSEEEQIDEVGSPSPAPSALKRFGSASNQQIRGNLEQAVARMYDECELEKGSGHAQQVGQCPVFCLINTLPPACVFVFCLHRHSLP
jgi:hypothetical protein